MASSQVEIVSSSPFGCVLRDRNRRERCGDSNVRVAPGAFEKNLKEIVKDHLHGSITSGSVSDGTSRNQISSIDSWIANGQGNSNRRSLRFLSDNNKGKSNNVDNGDDDSPIITPRQSRILDRWAARQAREMVSTIEKQVQEAELLASSNSQTASASSDVSSPSRLSSSSKENAQIFPTDRSNDGPKVQNLGASSLVQIWEARVNRSNSMNTSQNQDASRTSSEIASPLAEAARRYEMGDAMDERFDAQINGEFPLADWESQSDRAAVSEPPSLSQGRNSDAGEKERVKVAEIIKRLTCGSEDNNNDHEQEADHSPSRERRPVNVSDQAEQRVIAQVVNSPRLRGRQAFRDLLMQMQQDKQRELNSLAERQTVSKFPQRGRIQSMLRLTCLRRGLAIKDQCLPQASRAHVPVCRPQATPGEVNRSPQGTTIMHLREKFNTSTEPVLPTQSPVASPRSQHKDKDVANNTAHACGPSTSNNPPSENSQDREVSSTSTRYQGTLLEKHPLVSPSTENCCHQKVPSVGRQSKLLGEHSRADKNEELHEQPKLPSDITCHRTGLEARDLNSPKTAEATASSNDNQAVENQEANRQKHLHLESQNIRETTASLDGRAENEINEAGEEEDADEDEREHPYVDAEEIEETAASYHDWEGNEIAEEEEGGYQQYFYEANRNWFSDISRPRSYWENLRQTWYQEVLNASSENGEIRQLLERKRVSTFLASDFREKMDRLMISHVQMQVDPEEGQDNEESEDRMQQFMYYLQRHLHPTGDPEVENEERNDQVGEVEQQEEEEEEEDKEEDDEEERGGGSSISHQFHETSDYFDRSSQSIQMTSTSPIRSWCYQDDREVGDDSDRTPSNYSPAMAAFQAQCYQDSQQSSPSVNRPSLEMELVCDLRGQIEQLHREMAELRKSITSCMNMQMNLQQSFNHEVQSAPKEGKNSSDRAVVWKRSCCICYETQVDSLLYRCGHMCTCLKCAHALQWSSGKCPICRAPIVDVVRAYVDS